MNTDNMTNTDLNEIEFADVLELMVSLNHQLARLMRCITEAGLEIEPIDPDELHEIGLAVGEDSFSLANITEELSLAAREVEARNCPSE